MSSVDQFTSVFNAASKTAFQFSPPKFENILIVTDLESDAATQYTENAKTFFCKTTTSQWSTVNGEDFKTVKDLLELVESRKPDLIVTYRHLHSEAWRWPHSLGEHLDVLIQVTNAPVILTPHPDKEGIPEHTMKNTDSVMAINDHMAGEDALVNHATLLTMTGGTLHLTHIEDEAIFDRYMEIIGKIPEIDTETARETILAQLLREPSDYIDSTENVLSEKRDDLNIVKHITKGNQLKEYRRTIEENKVDLVVLKAHDEDQLAMSSTAYSLAVELRTTPLMIL
jgi:nucleotide-binding universal stress UspA family protein